MKAMIYEKYGNPSEVMYLVDLPKPELQSDEVLVKVMASSITFSDAAMVYGKPFMVRFFAGGMLKPKKKLLGKDISGTVEAIGSAVTQFSVGDEVFADLYNGGLKGYAEYVAVPEEWLVQKPANISFEEAAAVPESAVVALQGCAIWAIFRRVRKCWWWGLLAVLVLTRYRLPKYTAHM